MAGQPCWGTVLARQRARCLLFLYLLDLKGQETAGIATSSLLLGFFVGGGDVIPPSVPPSVKNPGNGAVIIPVKGWSFGSKI